MNGFLDPPPALVSGATPKPSSGTGAPGTDISASRANHAHPASAWQPDDYNWLAWTGDPLAATSTVTMAAGTLYVVRMKLARTSAISNVLVPLTAAGSGVTGSFVAVWSTAGTLLGVSADQGTSWLTAGTKTVALGSPTAVQDAGSSVLVGALTIGGTATVRAFGSAGTMNQGLAVPRYASLAAQTTPPNPLTGQAGSTTPILLMAS